MRPIRHVRPTNMYEVTTRTINRTKLLRPSKKVNAIIVGVLARARRLTGVQCYGLVFMSTHYHMLVGAESAEQVAKFMGYVNCNITVKLNDLNDRTGSSWSRRFHSILISNDRATQERRLRYLLAHGVKERLVSRCQDWPGVTGLPWLLHGKPIRGVWTSFTDRYHAERRASYVPTPGEFDTTLTLELSVLPCWRELEAPVWRARVAELVMEIETEAAQRCVDEGGVPLEERVLGAAAVLAADPQERLPRQRRSRAPSVHALCRVTKRQLRRELRGLREAYLEASERFRGGERDVAFPAGTFRPLGGFVGTGLTHAMT